MVLWEMESYMKENEIELIKMDYRIEYKNHNSKAQKKHRGKFLDISIGHIFFFFFFVFDTKSKDNKREKKKSVTTSN